MNCLKKMYSMEDSSEKKKMGMTVWSQVRIITSWVVTLDRINTSEPKILKNNSELSYWATEDVARMVQFIETLNMQLLFADIDIRTCCSASPNSSPSRGGRLIKS